MLCRRLLAAIALVSSTLFLESVGAAPSADELIRDVTAAYSQAETYAHESHGEFVSIREIKKGVYTSLRENGEPACVTRKSVKLKFMRDRGWLFEKQTVGDIFGPDCKPSAHIRSTTWSDLNCIWVHSNARIMDRESSELTDCEPVDRFQFFRYGFYWFSETIILDLLLRPDTVDYGNPSRRQVEEGALPDGDPVWILSVGNARGGTERLFIDRERSLIRRIERYPRQAPDIMVAAISYDIVEINPVLAEDDITYEPPTGSMIEREYVTKPLSWAGRLLQRFERVVERHAHLSLVIFTIVLFSIGYSLVRWAPARFLSIKVSFIAFWLLFPLFSIFAYGGIIFAMFLLPLLFPIPPALVWVGLGIVLARSIRESSTAARRLTIMGSVLFVVYLALLAVLMSGNLHF